MAGGAGVDLDPSPVVFPHESHHQLVGLEPVEPVGSTEVLGHRRTGGRVLVHGEHEARNPFVTRLHDHVAMMAQRARRPSGPDPPTVGSGPGR